MELQPPFFSFLLCAAFFQQEIKLLLLGAGESGKSTFAKQIRLLHAEQFSEREVEHFRALIFSNLLDNMRVLLTAAEHFGFSVNNTEAKERIFSPPEGYISLEDLTPLMTSDLNSLWKEPSIQKAYSRQSEFQIFDSAAYFFDNLDRVSSKGYKPDLQDILRTRAKTTGIIETHFAIKSRSFNLVDVGGQRSERKKWMHCFEGVTAVLFCVALSEYDLKLAEDDETNRMEESLKVFKDTANSQWFRETPIILFLNKKDLFEEKIKRVPLSVAFSDYKETCPHDYNHALNFIQDKFLELNENPKRTIYPHATCATDTKNVEVIFNIVKDVILNEILSKN